MNEETGVTTPHTEQSQTPHKPRVALMGEFSAGKSTLSNMLLGEAPFPTKVTATRLPPVWASYGEDAAFSVDHDGVEAPLDIDDLASVSLEETALIRLERPADVLELCDLIDMPGVSDPNMPADAWLPMIDEVDFVIWCTHANQAWRQSEAAIWERIVEQTNGHNILLVTQIDKIRNDRDRERVLNRVRKETDGLFEAVYPVSLLQVVEAGDDFDIQQERGAAAFIEHLVDILLKPAAPSPKSVIEWDTAPELPRKDVDGEKRLVSIVDRAPSPEQNDQNAEENSTPSSDPVYAAEPTVVPKRVRRPGGNTPRPARSEVAHG